MSNVKWLEDAWNDYCDIEDRKLIKRINRLINDISRNPYNGVGKPEHLKYSEGYSRRIDDKNRLIYFYEDNTIVIKACIGHYDDK